MVDDETCITVKNLFLKQLIKAAEVLLTLWFACCVLIFFMHILTAAWPRLTWQLPWGDIRDFVVSSQGMVFLRDGFQRRVLCYDQDGQFRYSFMIGTSRATLAIDGQDRLFVKSHERLVLQYDLDCNLLHQTERPNKESADEIEQVWVLGTTGTIESVPEVTANLELPPGTVQPGQCLFHRRGAGHSFQRLDGTLYRRNVCSIDQQLPDGTWHTVVRLPWYLVPFSFPCLVICWFSFILYGILVHRPKTFLQMMEHTESKFKNNSNRTKKKQIKQPWEINEASEKRWPVSFWRATLPPIIQSAAEWKRRLGMLQQYSDCCWHDMEMMLNPGGHPLVQKSLHQLKSLYLSDLPGAFRCMHDLADGVLQANSQAKRDEMCQAILQFTQTRDKEILANVKAVVNVGKAT